MLIKLIKYDIRADYKKYLITGAALLILSGIVRFIDVKFGNSADESNWKLVLELMVGALIMVCAGVLFMTTIISAVRYRNKMFSDEGYLMNTLPIHPSLHILSSIITNYLWTLAMAVLDLISMIIAAGGLDFWRGFSKPFGIMFDISQIYFVFVLITLIVSPITMMMTLILLINFANMFRSHRVLAGFGGYFILMAVSGLLSEILYAILGKSEVMLSTFRVLNDNNDYMTSNDSYVIVMKELAKLTDGMYLHFAIANVIMFVLLFVASSYILKKKINLD